MTALSKNRLKVIGCAIAVAAVTAALLVLLSAILLPKNGQKAFANVETGCGVLNESANTVDVLFIGDSEVFNTFSPLQMWNERGFTSYVCATSGQRLPYGNALLHRATENQKPKVVVIETNSVYAPFSFDDAALRAAQELVPVFENHNIWKQLVPGNGDGQYAPTWSTEFKGYYPNKDVRAADASSYMAASDKTEEIPAPNRAYLQSMIDYCREIGATPILVSTPSTVNWNMAKHNGMQAFAKQAGVDYIDLNTGKTKVDIDWNTETRDAGDHLNLSGATKVSAQFGKLLAERYHLPDHRNDSSYSAWNDSFAHYQKRIQE